MAAYIAYKQAHAHTSIHTCAAPASCHGPVVNSLLLHAHFLQLRLLGPSGASMSYSNIADYTSGQRDNWSWAHLKTFVGQDEAVEHFYAGEASLGLLACTSP